MVDISKLAEVLRKENGNIRVRCMYERERMETAPTCSYSYNLLDPCFYNEKISDDWDEQRPSVTTYADILRFVDAHKPSFFGKHKYCQPDIYAVSYKGFRKTIERAEEDYHSWREEFSPIANQLEDELNKETLQNVRLNRSSLNDNRLEVLTTDEDGLINSVTIEISDIAFSTQSKEALIRLFPQPHYGSDACCNIQLPAEYYKFLNWED